MDTRDLILCIGAMPGHNDRGIALIEYDNMNNPKRKVYLPLQAEIN